MLPSRSLPQMQGTYRSSPTICLCASLARRISWSHVAHWSTKSSISSSTLLPLASCWRAAHDSDVALRRVIPLPSAAQTERFPVEDTGSSGNHGSQEQEQRFRSSGSRSEPSFPSLPGKFSKYSKAISKLHTEAVRKGVERRDKKAFRKPMGDVAAKPDRNLFPLDESASPSDSAAKTSRKAFDPGQMPEWMQHYQFSYSETPTAPIVGFRQTPWSPFGPPDLVERPWTGSAPLKPSKKKLPAFDSFNPPPPGKKGVKYVQPPGPFPPGQGPKPSKSREEILGAPLTALEIKELVDAVNKRDKQVNLGRDGLTHNMLDVIHSHWKRSVCCKIKCKGVPTLDMDNVARVVEDKTGGVIIHRAGGAMYVFRGRNYNYKDRPKIPIMLWKPPDPIYPRLIQAVPEGLTEHEAQQLRGKGRRVVPLCKLSKNGVYLTLVAEVRAQLVIDEVVKVDCTGMNTTDYKKIGAKLKDLVPCTLLSFEKEQIVMCRKRPPKVEDAQQNQGDEQAADVSTDKVGSVADGGLHLPEESVRQEDNDNQNLVQVGAVNAAECDSPQAPAYTMETNSQDQSLSGDENFEGSVLVLDSAASSTDAGTKEELLTSNGITEDMTRSTYEASSSDRDEVTASSTSTAVDNVEELWQKAIEEGKAFQLDNETTDPDFVFEKAAEFSGVLDESESEDARLAKETLQESKIAPQISSIPPLDVPPMGGLGVDELAKLLAP